MLVATRSCFIRQWKVLLSVAVVLSNTHSITASEYTLEQLGQELEGEAAGDISGVSVALSNTGHIVAVGAQGNDGNDGQSGHARVYELIGGSWVQFGGDIDGEFSGDFSGFSIDLSSSGKIIAIGAIYNHGGADYGGHVRVFEYDGNIWEKMGEDIDGVDAEGHFGSSVTLSADGKIVAAMGTSGVSVHHYDGTAWNIVGEEIDCQCYDSSRSSIALSSDGTVLALGEHNPNKVSVFTYAENEWNPMGQVLTTGGVSFGHTLSLSSSGNILAIGAPQDGYGQVFVFHYNGTAWDSLGNPLYGNAHGDRFGWSLDLSSDGERLAVGSYFHHFGGSRPGIMAVYQYDGGDQWVQMDENIGGEAHHDYFGHSVALSGDGRIVAAGGPLNDGQNGTNSGHVKVYEIKRLTSPRASGDPHFKTWIGELYDYHGLCDLVLLQNHDFQSGLGMDIHIRTKKMKQWSFISNAVIRIGEDTLEIMGDANGQTVSYWINGVTGSQGELSNNALLGRSVSGFPIFYKRVNQKQHEFTVDLGNNEKIVVATWKQLVRVDIHGATEMNFGKSLGLMGTFHTGLHMGRDERTILTEFNDFGQEWQVLASEPRLFHNREGPQAPEKCSIPSATKLRRRLTENTISQEEAMIACARVNEEDRNMCIFDVMATNDMEVVGAY